MLIRVLPDGWYIPGLGVASAVAITIFIGLLTHILLFQKLFAIPDAMITAAGGVNVTHDLDTSWGRTSWEAVAAANPEFLVLLDYQTGNGAEDTFKFLKEHPVVSQTDAVRNKRWIGLRYEELTPGPANIDAIEKMTRAMHPVGN